jgi:hypothetical protein
MRETLEHNDLSAESFESQQNLPRISAEPFLYDRIAQRAYELWEERGRVDGEALGDWLRAEAEVMDSLARYSHDEGIDTYDRQAWLMSEASPRL